MVELEILKMGKQYRIIYIFFALWLLQAPAMAQPRVSPSGLGDSTGKAPDTLRMVSAPGPSVKNTDSTLIKKAEQIAQVLKHHPYFNFSEKAVPPAYKERPKSAGKELYFYGIAAILLLFAVFRTAFSSYFDEFTTLFFKRTLKHRQLHQKLSQNSLPAVVFNILFVLIAGCYLALAFQFFRVNHKLSFGLLAAYATAGLAIVYVGKFLLLKLAGWMFQLKPLTEAYIFLVFMVNKIIALALLPLIVAIALGGPTLQTVAWTVSWLLLIGLYIYRFVIAIGLVRKEASVSIFHFSLYLLAFEVLPIWAVYKLLLNF